MEFKHKSVLLEETVGKRKQRKNNGFIPLENHYNTII